jgi:hypothetical protein
VCWVRFEGTDGRPFGRHPGGGELSYWVCCVRVVVRDGRLLGKHLGRVRDIVLGVLDQI